MANLDRNHHCSYKRERGEAIWTSCVTKITSGFIKHTPTVEIHVVCDFSSKVLCVVGLLPAEGQSRTVAAQTTRWTLSGNLWHPEVGAAESLCLLQADMSVHCVMHQPWAQRDVMSVVWDNCHAALTSSVNLLTWLWQCCLTLLWPFSLASL